MRWESETRSQGSPSERGKKKKKADTAWIHRDSCYSSWFTPRIKPFNTHTWHKSHFSLHLQLPSSLEWPGKQPYPFVYLLFPRIFPFLFFLLHCFLAGATAFPQHYIFILKKFKIQPSFAQSVEFIYTHKAIKNHPQGYFVYETNTGKPSIL